MSLEQFYTNKARAVTICNNNSAAFSILYMPVEPNSKGLNFDNNNNGLMKRLEKCTLQEKQEKCYNGV